MKNSDVELVEMPPELAAMLRFQHELDFQEAGPKASVPWRLHRGVKLTSRWGVEQELVVMQEIVDALPDLIRHRLAEIWCDSKAQATYSVQAKPLLWSSEIEWAIQQAARSKNGGHNGTYLTGAEGQAATIEPDWDE